MPLGFSGSFEPISPVQFEPLVLFSLAGLGGIFPNHSCQQSLSKSLGKRLYCHLCFGKTYTSISSSLDWPDFVSNGIIWPLYPGRLGRQFSKSLIPVKFIQVTRQCLVTWKNFTVIPDMKEPYQHFLITGLACCCWQCQRLLSFLSNYQQRKEFFDSPESSG